MQEVLTFCLTKNRRVLGMVWFWRWLWTETLSLWTGCPLDTFVTKSRGLIVGFLDIVIRQSKESECSHTGN